MLLQVTELTRKELFCRCRHPYSVRFYPLLVAAGTAINRHQLAPLHVKLFFLVNQPLVVSVATQCLALVLLFEGGLVKRQYVSQIYSSMWCALKFS